MIVNDVIPFFVDKNMVLYPDVLEHTCHFQLLQSGLLQDQSLSITTH